MIYQIPLLLVISIFFNTAFAQKNQTKPNIILVFMDDLGYGDLGVTGALGYHTKVLDRMANNGIRFTNFLVPQAVCSASRSALLTGNYPNRMGISGAFMPSTGWRKCSRAKATAHRSSANGTLEANLNFFLPNKALTHIMEFPTPTICGQ